MSYLMFGKSVYRRASTEDAARLENDMRAGISRFGADDEKFKSS